MTNLGQLPFMLFTQMAQTWAIQKDSVNTSIIHLYSTAMVFMFSCHMASGDGVRDELHSSKQKLGIWSNYRWCALLYKWVHRLKEMSDSTNEGISTRLWHRFRRNIFTSGENDYPLFHAQRHGSRELGADSARCQNDIPPWWRRGAAKSLYDI